MDQRCLEVEGQDYPGFICVPHQPASAQARSAQDAASPVAPRRALGSL